MKFILYHHKNAALAQYVSHYASLGKVVPNATVEVVSQPQQSTHASWAKLPTKLRKLLFFARPDLVICLDDGVNPIHPVFAFEITEHVPARDHWMQRFVNLVGCAQERVPGAYIMPFDMSGHPKFPSRIDRFFFYAYDRITEIHQTPIFIAEWHTPDQVTPKGDATYPAFPDHTLPDMVRVFSFLRSAVEGAIHGRPVSLLMSERSIVELRDRIRRRAYSDELPQISDFKRLSVCMPDNRALNTREFTQWLEGEGHKLPADFPDRLTRRGRFLVFTPQADKRGKSKAQLRRALMTRIDQKGGDPYLGQPLVFDYLFCRLGPTPYHRDCNVVVNLTDLKFEDLAKFHRKFWLNSPLQHTKLSDVSDIPTYTMYLKEGGTEVLKNVLRVFAFSSDVIVFSDGMIYF